MPRTTTKVETARRVTYAAQRLVDALERHAEFKAAWDRIGDKHYQESRRQLVQALVDCAREIVRGGAGGAARVMATFACPSCSCFEVRRSLIARSSAA